MDACDAKFERVADVGEYPCYRVVIDGQELCYVWKLKTFWYEGANGINRGIRIRDHHPVEWAYGPSPGKADSRLTYQTRRLAVWKCVHWRQEAKEPR